MAIKTVYANKDAVMGKRLGGSFSGWNGKDDHLQVGATSNYRWRSVIYFPISFSGMTAINSARLYLVNQLTGASSHQTQLNPPSTLLVRRMTSDWGEGDTNPGEGQLTTQEPWDWDNRFDKYTTSGQNTRSITQGANGTEESILITDIVRAWFNGSPNYGVMLINDSSESSIGKAMLFRSRNFGSSGRAYVEIDYETNQAPNAPVSMTPTGGSVVQTLSPTLSMTRSDPDSGDYITAYQLSVIRHSDSFEMYNTGVINVSGQPTSVSHVYGSKSSALVGPFPLDEGVTYKWRAYTKDKAGAAGPVSDWHLFVPNAPPSAPTVVVTSSPTNDINDNTPSFTITHNDAGNANMYGYQFVIETMTGVVVFDSNNVDVSGSPAPTKAVTSGPLAFGAQYRIRARTQDDQGLWSVFSGYVTFTLHKAAVPTNLAPTGNAVTNSSPYLSGDRATSSDVITAYWLRVYTDNEASTPLPATRYTTGIEPGGSGFTKQYAGSALTAGAFYKWQVMIETASGDTSAWSTLQRFQVADALTPTLTSPLSSGIGTLTPSFTGQRDTAFNRFQYQLYAANGTTLLYDSGTLSATITGSGPYVFSSTYGGSPALSWATQYKWRARVSSDGGANWSSWSGLTSFTTSSAGVAVLNSPTVDQWITDSTPDFTIDRSGSDTIDQMQVLVYNASQQLIWDSGMTNVTNGTTGVGPITYAGPTLTGGDYYWTARYQSTIGPTGPYAPLRKFRLNRAPTIPSNLFPTPNYVFSNTLLPNFSAIFQDPDKATNADYPTEWDIDILDSDGDVLVTKNITAGLSSGTNTYQWDSGDYALSYGVQYMWRTRFKDSKGAWGTYSASSNFKAATPPNGTITTPSDGSNVASINPEITWTYSGGTQAQYKLRVVNVSNGAVVYETTPPVPGSDTVAFVNYLKNGGTYDITLTVWNTDGLEDPTPSTVRVTCVLDAPDPVSGLSVTTNPDRSLVWLNWDAPSVLKSGHTFVRYQVYRRVVGDVEWYEVGSTREFNPSPNGPRYADWLAGNSIRYEYRVTQVDTRANAGIELESPDGDENIVPAMLEADVWMFVGFDRTADHIVELPVSDEGHNRPVQQEEFEPLGSDRKVIMRGFVLGHEGSIQCIWINREVASPSDVQVFYNETVIGRRLVDYLTRNKGPHILKSPFGDVWEVEFQGPTYKWLDSGNLQVDLSWIETGNTSQVAV